MSVVLVCLVLYTCPPLLPLLVGWWLAEDTWRRKRWERAKESRATPNEPRR